MLAGGSVSHVVRREGELGRRKFRQDGQLSNLAPYLDRRLTAMMLGRIKVPYFFGAAILFYRKC